MGLIMSTNTSAPPATSTATLPQGLLDLPTASVSRSPERVIRWGGGRHVRFEVALEATSSAWLQARVLGLLPKRLAVIRIIV